MRTKVTLVLVFLNVALFFFIFKFERNWRTEAAAIEARRRVLGPESAHIRTIEVTSASPGISYRLERERDREQWMLTKPLHWPANPHATSSIVTELQLLEHETSFGVADLPKSGMSLADYGLENPRFTVTFGSGGSAATSRLKIGDTSKVGNRLYVLSPDEKRIHVVNRSLVDSLALPLEQLRADALFTIPVFEARALTIQPATSGAAGPRIRIRRETAGARWKFEAPIVAPASKLALDTTINALNALQAKSFPPASAASPATNPTLRVMLEGNNRNETLILGEPVPAPAAPASGTAPARPPAATGGEVEYYAQLEGRDALFTVAVPPKVIETLRTAQVALRERRVLDFDPRTVTAITIAAPIADQPPVLLQRLENPTDARDAGAWQIARRGDAAQGPQTRPADPALIQRLLTQLTLLTAKSFESDAPTSADLENWGFNRPEREVMLTFAASPGATNAPVMLRLGTDARREAVYARSGTPTDPGAAIYTVEPDILRELPADPVAWRHRLVHELPAAARISALKITDLAGIEKPVFETTFDVNGQPAAAPRDPAVLSALLAQLRKLQAKRFTHDGFVERGPPSGEEWRFRLEATIGLPGGAGEQSSTLTLFFTERLGGGRQLAGSKELAAVFEIEQPLIDALWPLTEGTRDPGPPPEAKK